MEDKRKLLWSKLIDTLSDALKNIKKAICWQY